MTRVLTLMAWGSVAVVSAVAALNWPALTSRAPLDLVVTQVHAPLGAAMLGVAAFVLTLFLVTALYSRIGAMMETRRLLREIQHMREVADGSEASRVDALRDFVATEFRSMNEQLSAIAESVQVGRSVPDAQSPALTRRIETRVGTAGISL